MERGGAPGRHEGSSVARSYPSMHQILNLGTFVRERHRLTVGVVAACDLLTSWFFQNHKNACMHGNTFKTDWYICRLCTANAETVFGRLQNARWPCAKKNRPVSTHLTDKEHQTADAQVHAPPNAVAHLAYRCAIQLTNQPFE